MVTILTTIISSGLMLVGVLISNRSNRIKFETKMEYELKDLKENIEQLKSDLQATRIELMELRDESRENDGQLKRSAMHNAKDRLNQGHRYFMRLGKIDEESLQSLLAVWDSYKELGGNSFIDREIKDIQSLPITNSLVYEIEK